MKDYAIAAIPADGIGPEVISAGVEVLHALAERQGDMRFSVHTFEWGSDYYKTHGVMMPEDGLEQLKSFDAIYFGAVGAPDVADHITLWGCVCQSVRALTSMPTFAQLKFCQAFSRHCARPCRARSTG